MKVLVAGCGISGQSALKFLKRKGYEAQYLDNKYLSTNLEILDEELDRLFEGLSFIVVSPGISLDTPILVEAKKRKISIIGELELGGRELKGSIISITGTNGKTTTTSLINFILSTLESNIFLGGNIGTAVTSFADKTKENDITVLECSSYQLETIESFKPHISAILNLSEDHLLRHKTMENYIKAKQNITKNQNENDYLLINYDNETLMNNIPKTKAKIMYFSTKNKVNGCYVKNNCIYFNDNQKEKRLISLKNIKLVGKHNLSNIVCAVLCVYLETRNIKILSQISKFQGIEHRIEYVKTINGIDFFNDSKATNIDSTLVAVNSFNRKINLILGGSEKGYDFDKLFVNFSKKIANIVVFGETKTKIYTTAKKYNFNNIYKCDD
ncbi:MAG: UDP-N-acetylmuramoyl-L-alanine--D-glutamate ligase [Clostridia bacterium]|nr:UDP-N-acetylmuramoyl-L-alanine--D-glutamate ligase [Clostridia bacterium]